MHEKFFESLKRFHLKIVEYIGKKGKVKSAKNKTE